MWAESWPIVTFISLHVILRFEAVGETRTQVWSAKFGLADTFTTFSVFHSTLDVRSSHEFVLLVSEVGLLSFLHLLKHQILLLERKLSELVKTLSLAQVQINEVFCLLQPVLLLLSHRVLSKIWLNVLADLYIVILEKLLVQTLSILLHRFRLIINKLYNKTGY